jgi:preprotein translocase subunit SecG
MLIFLTILYVIVCIFLVLAVLLQSGKAADLAGAFGGIGSQTVFGPRGAATALSKATAIAAVLFMCVSLTLSILAQRPSLLDKAAKAARGGTSAITVTPYTDGKKGQPLTIQLPSVQNPDGRK